MERRRLAEPALREQIEELLREQGLAGPASSAGMFRIDRRLGSPYDCNWKLEMLGGGPTPGDVPAFWRAIARAEQLFDVNWER